MSKSHTAISTYYDDDDFESLIDLIHKSFYVKSEKFANLLRSCVSFSVLLVLNMHIGS